MIGSVCQTESGKSADDAKLLQSLTRGLSVLEAFRNSEELSLNELTARAGLPKTTVFRILQTLEKLGYLDGATDSKYRLGIRILNIGRDGHAKHLLRQTAQPHLQSLQSTLGETVNLGVLEGVEVLYLQVLESRSSLRVVERPGSCSPLHASAMGKCQIAYLPEAELDRLLGSLNMRRFTERGDL
ncbi:MAG: IclR family transcriptional regulator [Bryobacteraceae bacterium]